MCHTLRLRCGSTCICIECCILLYSFLFFKFHSIAWECAFGRDAGFSPEQALALHMEHPTIEPSVGGAIPHPWQPEHILEDFEKVWEQLDALNEILGSP